MKIICVYKSGGDFDVRYVRALKASLNKHCSVPFDFYCLTDCPEEIKDYAIPVALKHNWPGWWSKLELFNPTSWLNNVADIKLYFDLDVLILKSIEKLLYVCYTSKDPMMLRSSDKVGKEKDWPSSSIITWRGQSMSEVYVQARKQGITKVIAKVNQNVYRAGQRTDQGFIRTIINPNKFQDLLPEGYIVFKYPDFIKDPKVLKTATILNWTGKPRFSKMNNSLNQIKMLWEEYHKINQIL